MNLSGTDMQIQEMHDRLSVERLRAEAAERKLAIALGADKPDKPATPTERARFWALEAATQKERAEAQAMELRLDLGAAVERANRLAIWAGRYGADQWRRGNAGQEPQEFEEWRREQP